MLEIRIFFFFFLLIDVLSKLREGPAPDAPVFTYLGPFLSPACPIRISCRWTMVNPLLPVKQASMSVSVTNGTFAPLTPNTNTSDLCNSFVDLPNLSGVQFTGVWGATNITGFWENPAQEASAVSPPDILLANLAVISTGGPIFIGGTTRVVAVDGRVFQSESSSFLCMWCFVSRRHF